MKTVAFFNNKGGVGKTSLVYHLAWMFADKGQRVIAVDLDPQANLSSMFLSDKELEDIWGGDRKTVDGDIKPLFDGSGDISKEPHIKWIDEQIGLLPGDLALSEREDDLSAQWPKCLGNNHRAFRVTTAFARLIEHACSISPGEVDMVLIDVGPNLGAINRSALIASDYLVIPLAPDLFSLQGLHNMGPTLRKWRAGWQERIQKKPHDLDINLPSGNMHPLGYIVMRRSVNLSRPVKAYGRWIEEMPLQYRKSILDEAKPKEVSSDADEHQLAHLKDYRSLMPLAQEANKPMFKLKPADGVIGGQNQAVLQCYRDFEALHRKITEKAVSP